MTPPLLERSEADAFLDLMSGGRHDTEGVRIGGAVVLSRPGPDASFWCQAVGFETPPTADLIGEIVEHYRRRRVEQARFILPPSAVPEDWAEITRKYALTEGGRALKLAAYAPFTVRPSTATPIGPDDYRRWSATMWDIFGMNSEANVDIAASALTHPALRAYACWDGPDIVATGLLRLSPTAAHLFSGATVPTHRGRGLQAQVIAARVAAAAEAGCPLLIAETGVAPHGYTTSARNLIRAGFTPQYERQTWLWTA